MVSKDYPIHKLDPNSNKLEFQIEEIAFNNQYNINAPHAHDYFEVFLFKSGGGFHTIDFETTEIEPNSVHLVLPGQIHHIGREGSCTGLVMLFSKEYISSNVSLLKTINNFPFLRKGTLPYINTVNSGTFSFLHETVSKVFNENASDGFNAKDIIQSYLNIILLKTQEVFENKRTNLSIPIQSLLSLLDKSCTNATNSETLCKLLNTSVSSLNNLAKKELGKSIKTLIKETLLTEIKKALLLGKNSIKTISYEFDFSDPSNFNKFFKRETGQTPLEFKKKNT